jgi:hypothetical protein
MRLRRLYDCTTPWEMDACETNMIDVEGTNVFSMLEVNLYVGEAKETYPELWSHYHRLNGRD